MRNVKTILLLTALAATGIASSGALAAESPVVTPTPSEVCKDLRAQIGVTTFKQTYGTNTNRANAFGKCVSANAKKVATAAASARTVCKAERAADPAAFKEKYGTNKNKNNAYGKCVSGKASAAADARVEALASAARACKAERALDAAAFKEKYGTNKNKRNAFGKCVSKLARTA